MRTWKREAPRGRRKGADPRHGRGTTNGYEKRRIAQRSWLQRMTDQQGYGRNDRHSDPGRTPLRSELTGASSALPEPACPVSAVNVHFTAHGAVKNLMGARFR
jgi:hypothetical protein